MLLKYIQHFVTTEGSTFFSNWFDNTLAKMKTVPGFVTAHFIPERNNPCHIHLFLYFDNEAALAKWTQTDAHESALKALAPYWTKPYVMQSATL